MLIFGIQLGIIKRTQSPMRKVNKSQSSKVKVKKEYEQEFFTVHKFLLNCNKRLVLLMG